MIHLRLGLREKNYIILYRQIIWLIIFLNILQSLNTMTFPVLKYHQKMPLFFFIKQQQVTTQALKVKMLFLLNSFLKFLELLILVIFKRINQQIISLKKELLLLIHGEKYFYQLLVHHILIFDLLIFLILHLLNLHQEHCKNICTPFKLHLLHRHLILL